MLYQLQEAYKRRSTCKNKFEVSREGTLVFVSEAGALVHPCPSSFHEGELTDTEKLNIAYIEIS